MFNLRQTTLTALLASSAAWAQQQPPAPPNPPARPAVLRMRTGPRTAIEAGPAGKWWDNPEMAKRVGITSEQKKRMDDAFYQSRLKLIDLRAAVEKDQLTLDNLMQAAPLDDSKILPALDKVAQDRAELEKADARMLLSIRHILTPEQWTTLEQAPPMPMDGRGAGDRRGPRVIGRGPGSAGGPMLLRRRGPGLPDTPPPPPGD